MRPSTIIENILYTADKLHFPDNGDGYDMKYYPAFVFYYSKMLKKYCPQFTATFFDYKLNSDRFTKTTTGDLISNRKLGDAGTFIRHFENNERMKQKLIDTYNETQFYTSHDIIDYLKQNGITIAPNHYQSNGITSSNFNQIFNGFVRYLVDNEWSFVNIKSLKIIGLDDAFIENRNDLRQIAIAITPQSVVKIASLLASDLDNAKDTFEHLKDAEKVDAGVLEEVHMSLSNKSRNLFENLLGMKFILDCLNDFG